MWVCILKCVVSGFFQSSEITWRVNMDVCRVLNVKGGKKLFKG